ncbi:branched-chain amino acid ABC transporter permease [Leucobacter salsicius]|uniref:branched-chain amino acid ABC transporter permease n=1 Tax=Leucobacter salsicius TaxID=664638 RepID=UPI000345D9F2|nr:branched-chain amino acid ABC transporter permease [Leucobacter salsicius]
MKLYRQNRTQNLITGAFLVAIIGVVALLGVLTDPIIERVAIGALISVVVVIGLSIYSGNSGIMSFGHVSFMAIGAYVTAFLTIPKGIKASMFSKLPDGLVFLKDIETPFPVAILVAAACAATYALLTAPAMARLSGLQSGIATLALLVITFTVINSWTDVTRGSSAMIGIPKATTPLVVFVCASVAAVVALMYKNSRSGLQLRASREDPEAALASGISIGRHRALAWVLSAAVCGAGGALYAAFLTTFSSRTFFLSLTFGFIMMIVIGGYLSTSGAVVGALSISVLQEVLRRLQDGQFTGGYALPGGVTDLVLSAILILVLIKAPTGIMGIRELGRPKLGVKGN